MGLRCIVQRQLRDFRWPYGARVHQFNDPFHVPAVPSHLGAQHFYAGRRRRRAVASTGDIDQPPTGFQDRETALLHLTAHGIENNIARGCGLDKILFAIVDRRIGDSLLVGDKCGAHTVPYIEVRNPTARMEHEASTSKVSDEKLFYSMQRGISEEEARYMIINGFCRGIFKELPFEFAMEASQLLKVSLEGAVG